MCLISADYQNFKCIEVAARPQACSEAATCSKGAGLQHIAGVASTIASDLQAGIPQVVPMPSPASLPLAATRPQREQALHGAVGSGSKSMLAPQVRWCSRGAAQKVVKDFLEAADGITRSTLNRTVLDSGLRRDRLSVSLRVQRPSSSAARQNREYHNSVQGLSGAGKNRHHGVLWEPLHRYGRPCHARGPVSDINRSDLLSGVFIAAQRKTGQCVGAAWQAPVDECQALLLEGYQNWRENC